MRGDQLARQWRILRAIEADKNGLTIAEIAGQEEISLRTAYRDIEALQAAGFPLYYERFEGSNRWFFVDNYKFKVPQPFTVTELMSLHLYSDLVRVFQGTPFYEALESLFKKVRVTLPPQALNYLNTIQSTFQVGIKPFKEYGRFREILSQVNRAALESLRLEIAYKSLTSETETLRKVDPYKVWFFDGTFYLIGHCHVREEVRTFVLDRIRMLRLTEEHFEIPPDFSLEDYMKHSFKVMQGDLYTVRIRISAEWARYIGEKIWHESQKAERLPDGRLDLTFQVAGLEEIKQWVLSLGPQAVVMEPTELIELVLADLSSVRMQYDTETAIPQRMRER